MNHRRKPDLGAAAIVAPQAEAARDLARRDAALLAPDAARNLPQPDATPDAMRASPTPDAAPVARAAAHGSVAPDAARTSQAPDAARRSSSSDASAVTHSSSLPDAPTIPEFPSARPRQMKWIPKG
ncbi:hypothetical protein PR202_ga25514 [Eleusine coracana subsp. coracana]|uniref:Uncharacterized protein n=1 Tax=Eleusine coracana subsp. coracana TaxID=191504 RepID=A0AAV5DB60_ELECO|nr:hypothetical protein PR202_ga25514 [Eleusine coracana subsp. coracana]